MKAHDAALSLPWAITEEGLQQILTIASRDHQITDKALDQFRADQLRNADAATKRDGIAILPVMGPLFKRANLFTAISGATSYDVLMRDLETALSDDSVTGIMLQVDSPGGEASGSDEFAQAVYEGRKRKPIYAHISGVGASAAYWIASAAEKIYVSELANVGSIGVVAGVRVCKDAEGASSKTYEFVSSQSPNKRPDFESDEGRKAMQARVDDMAAVFIGAVARNRSATAEEVVSKFGKGGVLIGAQAVAAGMVDQVGLFEAAMADLKKSGSRRTTSQTRGYRMTDKTEGGTTANQKDDQAIRAEASAEGAKAERQRISAINSHADAGKLPTLVAKLVDEGTSADEAATILSAAAADMPKASEQAAAGSNAEETEASFAERKQQAVDLGAMGTGASVTENPMAKAVAAANKTRIK